MKSSCLSIEKPQSSNRSARSQNAQAYQIKTNTSHKRHCRASGFVQEPDPVIVVLCCARTPREKCGVSEKLHAAAQRQKQTFMHVAA